uniref:SMODS and SLOG-associating 2TM effector domain-containing protein n=1 Tax=viral metagenome TaxID=1070528 RepID=A0A6C0IVD6_9ZZZZ
MNIGQHKTKQHELVEKMNDLRRQTKKNKALLSFKYDNLDFKINFIHISVIIISTVITFIESIKSYYELENTIWDVVPIILATYIALIMAILRFLKLEDKKEQIAQSRENHIFILNKFIKTIELVENFQIKESNIDQWNNIVSNYENEIFDNYISIRTGFDTILDFTDVIYYKKKFLQYYLDEQFVNEDIDNIRRYKRIPNTKYKQKSCCSCLDGCFSSSTKSNLDSFFKDIEKGDLESYRNIHKNKIDSNNDTINDNKCNSNDDNTNKKPINIDNVSVV